MMTSSAAPSVATPKCGPFPRLPAADSIRHTDTGTVRGQKRPSVARQIGMNPFVIFVPPPDARAHAWAAGSATKTQPAPEGSIVELGCFHNMSAQGSKTFRCNVVLYILCLGRLKVSRWLPCHCPRVSLLLLRGLPRRQNSCLESAILPIHLEVVSEVNNSRQQVNHSPLAIRIP